MSQNKPFIPSEYDAVIFTDGSSRGNPGPGGWGMVVVLPKIGWVDEFGAGSNRTTNNEMELTAILEGLQYVRLKDPRMKALVLSDSSYALNGIQSWVSGWKRRGWKTAAGGEVANLEIWKQILELKDLVNMDYRHIRGHSGIAGNERVDAIATAYADSVEPHLYSGKFTQYPVQNILDLTMTAVPRGKSSAGTQTQSKDSWYVSLVGGVLAQHSNWPSCKERVHGVKAKFKKVSSKSEEAQVLREWGCNS